VSRAVVAIKRVYAPSADDDGQRVLVDRLWPRGVSKEAARIDLWLKDVSPSNTLRKRFHGRPDAWDAFCAAYAEELQSPPANQALDTLKAMVRSGKVTLLYAARDEARNNAVALSKHLMGRTARKPG
jgi:uncharacterized protein YeaO (DUF488 family)